MGVSTHSRRIAGKFSRGYWRFLIWRLVITWHECALIKVDRLLNSAKTVAMETFQVESCVRGHHIYKDVWSPYLGVVYCNALANSKNTKDRYAVAVVRRSHTVVGHIPRKIAAASALFLARNYLL